MFNASAEILNYNKLSWLTNYTKGAISVSYLHDPFAKRISKTVNGIRTWYLWDRSTLLTEYNNSGQQQKRYAYLPGSFTPIQLADANGIYDVFKDHLGAPRLLIDSTKNIV